MDTDIDKKEKQNQYYEKWKENNYDKIVNARKTWYDNNKNTDEYKERARNYQRAYYNKKKLEKQEKIKNEELSEKIIEKIINNKLDELFDKILEEKLKNKNIITKENN